MSFDSTNGQSIKLQINSYFMLHRRNNEEINSSNGPIISMKLRDFVELLDKPRNPLRINPKPLGFRASHIRNHSHIYMYDAGIKVVVNMDFSCLI
jgi:hypothetical protein